MGLITSEQEFDRLPHTVQMRQDLQDPARRIAVREEYKQGLPEFYPDIGEQLQLTQTQVDRLFDLLADFQMRHLDAFYIRESDHRAKPARLRENDQRREEALSSLLGPDTLQRYRCYEQELPERQAVAWLARRWLDPANALSSEQKSQLMTVLRAEREQADSQYRERLSQRHRGPVPVTDPERARERLWEENIRANEDNFQELQAGSLRLLQRAASFLSVVQLAALAKMENHKLEGQRRWVDSLRAQKPNADADTQRGRTGFYIHAESDDPEAPGPG